MPAYYADIRGGRPIRPELLEELTERYRRLGIEESNPLNEITERTRAALEAELGLPVFTGMKHWTPRIADAVEAALAGGAETIVGLVLAPHYSRLSIGGYRAAARGGARRPGRARSSSRAGTTSRASSSSCAERVRGTAGARRLHRALASPRGSSTKATRTRTQLLETATAIAQAAGLSEWSLQLPVRVRRPASRGSARTSSTTSTALHAQGVDDVLVCPIGFVADHLEIRWDLDTEAREKADELGLRLERIEMPNDDPAFVAVLAGSSGGARAVGSTRRQ